MSLGGWKPSHISGHVEDHTYIHGGSMPAIVSPQNSYIDVPTQPPVLQNVTLFGDGIIRVK
jgi:hypothetical protein